MSSYPTCNPAMLLCRLFLVGIWFPPWLLNSMCLQHSVEMQLYFLWLKVTTRFDTMLHLFWQSHPWHKKHRSREPPWTDPLHRRTKITGIKKTYSIVGTEMTCTIPVWTGGLYFTTYNTWQGISLKTVCRETWGVDLKVQGVWTNKRRFLG